MYNNEELIAQFCTFFTAGTDTTAHFLMMMIYYICEKPEIEKKLRDQIDEHIKNDGDYTF